MREHVSIRGRKAKEHGSTPLWKDRTLQTYFVGEVRIDYFVVCNGQQDGGDGGDTGREGMSERPIALKRLTEGKICLERLEKDFAGVRNDVNLTLLA